jgi:hypothetical protein
MIWNDALLFIHVPKTGGMSVSKALLEHLPRPSFCSVPAGQRDAEDPPDVTYVQGKRHENLDEAEALLRTYNTRLRAFKRIIAIVRNPYGMEVSRYFYLRLGHPWDKGPAQRLAMERSFEDFALQSPYLGRPDTRVDAFYTYEGNVPENMRILRQERLQAELTEVAIQLGWGHIDWSLPNANRTSHGPYREYLTAASEEAIYLRFRWIFDQGYYARVRF